MSKFKKSNLAINGLCVDEIGTIFYYEGRVFRAINNRYKEQVEGMFDCGFVDEIVDKNLFPKTKIADISVEGHSLILEHKPIKPWNYPYEWSFDMLKDAALAVLKLNDVANKYGYELVDGHVFNLVFDMNKPKYIDFGSFRKLDRPAQCGWKGYVFFYSSIYVPLYLWVSGFSDVARNIFFMRHLFSDKEFFKIKHPLLSIMPFNPFFRLSSLIKKISLVSEKEIKSKSKGMLKKQTALLVYRAFKYYFTSKRISKSIIKLNKPIVNAVSRRRSTVEEPASKNLFAIAKMINSLTDAKSLCEVNSNNGELAGYLLKNTNIDKVVEVHYDKQAVNGIYLQYRDEKRILPLLFDIIKINGRSCDIGIGQRIKCDIVVVGKIMPHLFLTKKIPLDFAFKTLRKITNNYIIIEFVATEPDSNKPANDLFAFDVYSPKRFMYKFKKYFYLISKQKIEGDRYLLMGKIK